MWNQCPALRCWATEQRSNGASPHQRVRCIQVYSFGKRRWHWISRCSSENDDRELMIKSWLELIELERIVYENLILFIELKLSRADQAHAAQRRADQVESLGKQKRHVTQANAVRFFMSLGPPPCVRAPVWGLRRRDGFEWRFRFVSVHAVSTVRFRWHNWLKLFIRCKRCECKSALFLWFHEAIVLSSWVATEKIKCELWFVPCDNNNKGEIIERSSNWCSDSMH